MIDWTRVARSSLLGIALTTLSTAPIGQAADNAAPLILERTIPLDDVAGRIDHLAIDPARHRLLVAELGNYSVDVIDLKSGKVVHRFGGLSEPQGVAYLAKTDLIAVANAGDGSVQFFHAGDFAPAGSLALGADADNCRVDPRSGNLMVGYGDGAIALIDAERLTKLGDFKLEAHPEAFQIDAALNRIFVNVPDADQIAVVDLSAGRQVATWRVPDARVNFPMAIDSTGSEFATAFRSPARLAILDMRSGAIRANVETCGDADDVFFDQRRRRIYVSCGAGVVDVFALEAAAAVRIAQIETGSGARTSLFDPELDRLFVARRAGWFGSSAAILVFRPAP